MARSKKITARSKKITVGVLPGRIILTSRSKLKKFKKRPERALNKLIKMIKDN